jgi:hypothetical protein
MRVGSKTGAGISIRVWDVRPNHDGTYTWTARPPLPDWLQTTDTGTYPECRCPNCHADDQAQSSGAERPETT